MDHAQVEDIASATYLSCSITKLKLARFVVDRDHHCKGIEKQKVSVNFILKIKLGFDLF